MKPFFKFIAIVSVIPLLIVLYFFDNIKGYYRFKQYCEKEGGLKVYQPLEKNVGWLTKDYLYARTISSIDHVDFARYQDDEGVFDLKYKGDKREVDSSYLKTLASDSKTVIYRWDRVNRMVPNELRLARSGYEIFDINTNKLMVRYYYFNYSRFDRSKTILDAPSSISCFNDRGENFDGVDQAFKKLNDAFKK